MFVVAIYFAYVIMSVKLRLNWQSKIKMALVAIAFTLRASLSVYDCFVSFEVIVE